MNDNDNELFRLSRRDWWLLVFSIIGSSTLVLLFVYAGFKHAMEGLGL